MSNPPSIPPTVDFNRSPFLVLWELTRACALACQHCRARAIRQRNPYELSTAEGALLLKRLQEFGRPLIVLTGGDPIQRPDVFELIEEARRCGFKVAMTPSATASVTRDIVRKLKKAGLERIAVSLDGPDAETHDAFRRVRGSFEWSKSILSWAREFDLPIQINTTICRHNLARFEEMTALAAELGAVLWSAFFLVVVGRARSEMQITAGEAEAVLERMADLAQTAPYDVKATAAPHFRRVLIQKYVGADAAPAAALTAPVARARSNAEQGKVRQLDSALRLGALRSYQSVNDGKGLLFISDTGDIQPSGFLPVVAGNVRTDDVVSIYRNSELFRTLREPGLLKGKCGTCRFRAVCGGSRARAYGETGDYMAQDNLCSYYDQ
ncbi:MAG TPA: TIGR04053 family radical SAM/SPASM domain-containing protein [Candidatus Obscuribacterales bacterium]